MGAITCFMCLPFQDHLCKEVAKLPGGSSPDDFICQKSKYWSECMQWSCVTRAQTVPKCMIWRKSSKHLAAAARIVVLVVIRQPESFCYEVPFLYWLPAQRRMAPWKLAAQRAVPWVQIGCLRCAGLPLVSGGSSPHWPAERGCWVEELSLAELAPKQCG